MLDKNGYLLRVSGSTISFTKSRDLNWLVILIGFICTLLIIGFIRTPISGLIICGSLVSLSWLIVLLTRKKPFFELNLSNQRFRHHEFTTLQPMGNITEISAQTNFESEYTSAFKETSEEYSVKLKLTLNSGVQLNLFKLSSDYKELPPEIEEFYNYLKTLITLAKQHNPTPQ